jgi:hypothetical protein
MLRMTLPGPGGVVRDFESPVSTAIHLARASPVVTVRLAQALHIFPPSAIFSPAFRCAAQRED